MVMKMKILMVFIALILSGCIDDIRIDDRGYEVVRTYEIPGENVNVSARYLLDVSPVSCFDGAVTLTANDGFLQGTIPASLLDYDGDVTATTIFCDINREDEELGYVFVIPPIGPVLNPIPHITVTEGQGVSISVSSGDNIQGRGAVHSVDGYIGGLKVLASTGAIVTEADDVACDVTYQAVYHVETPAGTDSTPITITVQDTNGTGDSSNC